MAKFERIRYPDGQIGAKFVGDSLNHFPEFTIKERINSYEDLMYIRAIADIIQDRGVPHSWRLSIPCLFGQRSDRRFTTKQSFDLKLICEIINACKFGRVDVLDPHSEISLALIDRVTKRSPLGYVLKAVADIGTVALTLVSPDAGAYKKVFDFGADLKLPVMAAVKHRDEKGDINLVFTHDVKGKTCLIVDDLCDGGYTFELLAKELKKNGAEKVYLYVTHGLFSKGFDKMKEAGIDRIFCTNSVKDVTDDFVTQYNVI